MTGKFFALAAIAIVLTLSGVRAQPLKTAVFDFELVNTSTGLPPTEAESARVVMLSERLRQGLDKSDLFEVVDIGPVSEKARHSNLQACGGCDRTLAKEVGADLAFTGVIHKISELVLNLRIFARDTGSGKVIAAFNADIRGNNDKSWMRGLDWLLEHRILPKEETQ